MKTSVEKLDKSRVRLHIDVDAEQLEEALDGAYKKVRKKVTVPGFRKGRVPRAILERQYGQGILYEDAIDILLPKVYSEAVKEQDIHPVDQPDVDIDDLEPGKGVTFKVEVDVYPDITLGEYKGLEAEKEVETVTDEDVDNVLNNMRERQSELVVVDSRDEVKEGDFAVIDFKGYLNGEPFSGGAAENHTLEIGSGQFIPGFEEQLIGAKVGEEKEVSVTFPEDYHSEELAGKEVVFKVKINELKEKLLPELDDEFAKDVSEQETLEELKAEVRKDLEEQATRRTDSKLENILVEKVIEGSEIEVPESMVNKQAEYLVEDFSRNLMYQGLDLERYLEMTGQSREEMMENMRPEAETQLKKDLVIDAIADKEGIEVTEEEINKRIDELVEKSPQPEQARKMYEARKDNLKISIKVEKTYDFLKNNAQITEVAAEKE